MAKLLDALERGAARAAARLFVFALVAAAFAWPALELGAGLNEFRDAQVLRQYEKVAVEAVRAGDLPLWNPYYCGGMYALGSPQARFASPTFLLSVLFGAGRAEALAAFLMLLLGLEGFYRYARDRTGTALGPLVAAPLFALQGFFATLVPHGWIGFFSFELLPWLLLGVRLTSRARPAGVALVAGAFAWMIGFGGSYAVVFGALAALGEGVASLWPARHEPRQAARRLGWLAFAALAALGACAFRLWPIVETLEAAPRIMLGTPGNSPAKLLRMLAHPVASHGGNLTPRGLFFVPLFGLVAAVAGLSRRQVFPLIGLALSLWMAAGYEPAWSLFAALRELPVLEVLRYPDRFLVLAVFFAAVLVAAGCTRLQRAASARPGAAVVALLLAALPAAGIPALVDNHATAVAGIQHAPPPPERNEVFRQARGNRWLAAHWPALKRGSLHCWEAYPVPMSSALRGDLPHEEYLADPKAGQVRRLAWSPNGMRIAVDLQRPATLRINQNHHPGWRASVGDVVSDEGLLAVKLPAGQHEVVLRFLPRSALGGTLVSFTAWLAILLLARLTRSGNAHEGMAAGVVLLGCGVALAWAIPQPSRADPMPRNADGTPALAPQARCGDEEPTPFPVHVTLLGACVPERSDPGEVVVELNWQVTGDVPWDVAVFVHFQREGGGFVTADHHAIAASFTFAGAPRGVAIRDRAGAFLDQRGTWQVWAGLWTVGENSRRIMPPGGGDDGEGRIHLGTVEVR